MPTHAVIATPATGWRRVAPNWLTALRVVLAIVVVAALSARPTAATLAVALATFIAASLTDALDGYLARRWNAVSRFGRVMDPFADKILVLSTLVMLAGPALHDHETARQLSGVHPWMVIVVLGRDLLVTSIRAVYEARGIDFSASLSGKLKMIVQSVAIPVILLTLWLSAGNPQGPAAAVINAAAWTLTLGTALSAIAYVQRAIAADRGAAA